MNRSALLAAAAFFPVLLTVQTGLVDATAAAELESARRRTAEFNEQVQPFLRKYCTECHGADLQQGDVSLHAVELASLGDDDAALWAKVAEKLTFAEMPPADATQPSRTQRAAVANWISARLSEAGREPEWRHKLLYPEYGNLIDHDALFRGTVEGPAYTPSRLWKKSPHIFDSLMLRGVGFGTGRYGALHPNLAKVKQPFTMEDKTGVKDFAAIMTADSATLGTMLRNAEVIVDRHLEGALHELDEQRNGPTPEDQLPKDKNGKPIRPRYAKTADEFRTILFREDSPTDDEVDAATNKMFNLLIERQPSDEELVKYRQLMRECAAIGGTAEGLRTMLMAIAISPPAIYRMELGQGPTDEHGRRLLGPADLAFAIAYALTDQKPDDALLEAAQSGRLRGRDDAAREVARILDDESIEKPRILRFFHEFFGYHRAPQVFKDEARFGRQYDRSKTPEQLVQDADTLVLHILRRDRNVLAELLTTEEYFVLHSGDNEQARHTNESLTKFYNYLKDKGWAEFPYATPPEHAEYVRKIDRMFAHPNGNVVKGWMRYLEKCQKNGVTPVPQMKNREFLAAYNLDERSFDYPVEQPFPLAPGKRAGLLMHPAWLIAHSLNLDNDPVRRGKWIRERLLADTVPELPITVDARIPEEPDQTLRHRFRVTRQAECWRCHVQMNPLGMPFELYDDFGRYREVEKLHAAGKTAAVDCRGVLDGTGDPALDGEVDDPIEMMQRLARSERVRQSFVRHAFRYWMGRNEMLSDAPTLLAADRAYVEGGGSFRALVLSLLTSDSFLYRKTVGADDE
ncbi:MAG: DUF1588 domain-containing protein [Pirellulaceae bacterium]